MALTREEKIAAIKECSHSLLLNELVDRAGTKDVRPTGIKEKKFWNCVRFKYSVDRRDVVEGSKSVDAHFAMRVLALIPGKVSLPQMKAVLWALAQLKTKAVADVSRDCFDYDYIG